MLNKFKNLYLSLFLESGLVIGGFLLFICLISIPAVRQTNSVPHATNPDRLNRALHLENVAANSLCTPREKNLHLNSFS